jgi:8-oxo-dGTP pyrophosphatase MutT (NUDIX family)
MIDETKIPIQSLTSRIAWESPWYRIRQDDILLPDGTKGVYNVVEMNASAFVVPVLEDGRIVLIRNYRHTLKQWVWEIPAGSIREDQNPEEAAQAELLEEAGGIAKELIFMQKASTMNGIGEQYAYFFLAKGVQLQSQAQEKTEFINVYLMPADEVYRLVFAGEMNDAVSMTALLLAKSRL